MSIEGREQNGDRVQHSAWANKKFCSQLCRAYTIGRKKDTIIQLRLNNSLRATKRLRRSTSNLEVSMESSTNEENAMKRHQITTKSQQNGYKIHIINQQISLTNRLKFGTITLLQGLGKSKTRDFFSFLACQIKAIYFTSHTTEAFLNFLFPDLNNSFSLLIYIKD